MKRSFLVPCALGAFLFCAGVVCAAQNPKSKSNKQATQSPQQMATKIIAWDANSAL